MNQEGKQGKKKQAPESLNENALDALPTAKDRHQGLQHRTTVHGKKP